MKIMIAHVMQSIPETACDQTSRFVKNCPVRDNA